MEVYIMYIMSCRTTDIVHKLHKVYLVLPFRSKPGIFVTNVPLYIEMGINR